MTFSQLVSLNALWTTAHRIPYILTLFDGVVAVAVGVVGHVSEQRVVGVRVFGTQAVGVCSCVGAASPCEFT